MKRVNQPGHDFSWHVVAKIGAEHPQSKVRIQLQCALCEGVPIINVDRTGLGNPSGQKSGKFVERGAGLSARDRVLIMETDHTLQVYMRMTACLLEQALVQMNMRQKLRFYNLWS